MKIHFTALSNLFIPHTFSHEAMKLMTGFVDVALSVSVQLQTTQRQYDMESSRSPIDRAPDRLAELQATLSLVTHSATLTFNWIVWKESCWNIWVFFLVQRGLFVLQGRHHLFSIGSPDVDLQQIRTFYFFIF